MKLNTVRDTSRRSRLELQLLSQELLSTKLVTCSMSTTAGTTVVNDRAVLVSNKSVMCHPIIVLKTVYKFAVVTD